MLLISGVLSAIAAPPTVIGTEANVAFPPSANWNELVNISPGSNETVTVNPPLFSWFYAPGNPLNQAVDQNVYFFHLQADYNGSFASPVVDVTTPSCCYNFLAPFSASPVYWRVTYLTTNGVPVSSITNMFIIDPAATNWDRSMMASQSYLASKGGHPHLLFNSANKAAVAQFVQTNNPTQWQGVVSFAALGTNSSYWTNPAPWPQNPNLFGPGVETAAIEISSAAFLWQLTGNPAWTNYLCTNFDNMVNCFVSSGFLGANGFNTDYGNSGGDNIWVRSIAYAYDWLYPILTPAERVNAQDALDRVIRLNLYNEFWVTCANKSLSVFPGGHVDMTSVYPGPYIVPYAMPQKLGTGHGWFTTAASWISALACFGDNYTNAAWPVYAPGYPSDAAAFLDLGLNYMLGKGTPHGFACVDDSRGYGIEDTINSTFLYDMINAGIVFPEAQLNTHPGWAGEANWWINMLPPGYESVHDQWGDVGAPTSSMMRYPTSGRDLAIFSGSPAASQYYKSVNQFYGPSGINVYYNEIVPPFYYAMPAPQPCPTTATYAAADGWAWGATYPQNTVNCFSNGVGFIFAARPKGQNGGVGHAQFNDLNFEIFGYGANITDGVGGSDYGSKLSWSYNTVQVNGLGQAQSQEGPIVPAVARLLAFTNSTDFTYCAGDATYAYPHTPFPFAGDPGGWLIPPTYVSLLSGGPLANLTKMQRHILFEHHQYFVIFDDMASSTPANFEWVYHAYQSNGLPVNNLTTGGSFNYSVTPMSHPYPWTNVNVYVYQVVNPLLLSAVDEYGTNAYKNPVTGEDYFADAMNDLTNGTANPLQNNVIWVTNLTPTNQFHFMTVIYPVPPGGTPPSIGRIDDYTVAVTNGGQVDVISFDPKTTNAYTLLVNSPYINTSSSALPAPPTPLYTNSYSSTAQSTNGNPSQNTGPALSAVNAWIISNQVPSTFAPVPGYYAWWNSDTLTGSNGSLVASWVDSSSNAFNLGQSTAAAQPIIEVQMQNGRNCLLFNGINNFLTTTGMLPLNQPLEIFCVAHPANLNFNGIVVGNASGNALGMGVYNNKYFEVAGDGLLGGTEASAWLAMTAIFNGTSAQFFVNGTQVIAPGNNVGSDNLSGVELGAMFNGSQTYFWNGHIGDVIIYTNVLSTANQQAVEAGLRAKYGF